MNQSVCLSFVLIVKTPDFNSSPFSISIGIYPHEPVSLPVLCSNCEDSRLQLLSVLHFHLLGEVCNTPGMVILGVWLVVCERPTGGENGRLLDPRGRGRGFRGPSHTRVGHNTRIVTPHPSLLTGEHYTAFLINATTFNIDLKSLVEVNQ